MKTKVVLIVLGVGGLCLLAIWLLNTFVYEF